MSRPGFYNDNEYRAYPFVFQPNINALPTSAVVDAGVVMRADSGFDDETHSVWLSKITRDGDQFIFELKTDAIDTPLVFVRDAAASEWQIEYAESAQNSLCEKPVDPAWEGFLVTGPLKDLNIFLSASGDATFDKNEYQLEPARIQNLNKAYLRTVNVGNYERSVIDCATGTAPVLANPDIVVNKECLHGNIRFKEGYKCVIRQLDYANEISIGAAATAGTQTDEELCSNGSELPLFPDELLPPCSKFFSGGPACSDLIFTVNGLGGPNIIIAGGTGVSIATTDDEVKITRNTKTTDSGC